MTEETIRVRLAPKLEKDFRVAQKYEGTGGVPMNIPARGRQLFDSISGVTIFRGNLNYTLKNGQEVPLTKNIKQWLKADLLIEVKGETPPDPLKAPE